MTNKIFATVFIVIYLGQFFFCMFFRIESWPFSDYKVFQRSAHPQSAKVYIPCFKLPDGAYIQAIINNQIVFDINALYFNKASMKYFKHNSPDYEKYISKLIKSD